MPRCWRPNGCLTSSPAAMSDTMGTSAQAANYDKFPVIEVPDSEGACSVGWDAIARQLQRAISAQSMARTVLAVDCYPGVHAADVRHQLERRLQPRLVIDTNRLMRPVPEIEQSVAPFLGGDDPVFGYLTYLSLLDWFDDGAVAAARRQMEQVKEGTVLIVGCGAWQLGSAGILVYADLARWEAQQRFRRNEISNLGVENRTQPAHLQYKRAFFVDWRVADRWKQLVIDRCNFMLDTNDVNRPKLADADVVRSGLRHAATRPFRVVPYFDPAPWGGQWMRTVCQLDEAAPNYGWCFDCVPEENSLLLGIGGERFELPASDLVFYQPDQLLGEAVHARFGKEFPIRFDLLDTMGGGNLSFQVHPLTEYIQQHFGMHYTQDESYYLLDAGPDASVYLGLKDGIDQHAMQHELHLAQQGRGSFDVERYVNRWTASKHDHFSIPAGTCHCSGTNCLVLEISATPYIFTFKLWDWDRLGLDGRPRPIHLDHGLANAQWDRTTNWVRERLINRVRPISAGPGWREESTGLDASQFIETRRHWFTETVAHDTAGGVNVLNLVEGTEAVVESPSDAFAPFTVHYAETFIIPAQVGAYTVRPLPGHANHPHATIKAFVRHSA